MQFLGRHFGGAGVGAEPQFSGRAFRWSQNGPAGAPAGYKIVGAGRDALSQSSITGLANLSPHVPTGNILAYCLGSETDLLPHSFRLFLLRVYSCLPGQFDASPDGDASWRCQRRGSDICRLGSRVENRRLDVMLWRDTRRSSPDLGWIWRCAAVLFLAIGL
jgi:hypothetical protein